MIRISSLKKEYGTTHALKGIDLHVYSGELFAFLGPNGAGKSTTIRILTGLTRPGKGEVLLNNYNIETNSLLAKRECGLVTQYINLDSELTVSENLQIHGRLFNMSSDKRKKRIKTLLAYIEMEDRIDTLVKNLSGGLKRRLMIARALMHSPAILFLDEPTVGLDAAIRRRIWSLIKKVQQDGATIFLTTHYIEEAEFLADRVAFIDQGEIVALDRPKALMDGMGAWAVDHLEDNEMKTRYFKTRQDARSLIIAHDNGFTLRRVNLEDAFLALTGRKVQ